MQQQAAGGKCAASSPSAQRTHLFSALTALTALERYRLETDVPYPEAKAALLRDAVTSRLLDQHPLCALLPA